MLKKTIKYEDFNGLTREEDFYFNLSKAELMERELTTVGSYTEALRKMVKANEVTDLTKTLKDLILAAYGEKSPDGKRFIKSAELSKAFSETPAYDSLFMELLTDADAAVKFLTALIPPDLRAKAVEEAAAQSGGEFASAELLNHA